MTSELPPTVKSVTQFFPPKLMQWLGPVIALTLFGVFVAVVIASTGLLAFPASLPDPEGFTRIVHSSFKRSVDQHSDDIAVPADLDAPWRVQLGAAHFALTCAACHGVPGRGQNPVALSMRPRPQYLPKVVDQFKPNQLFWIVKHGVKFAGMPAWPTQKRDDEIWSVVAFLRHSPEMTASQFDTLALGPDEAGGAAAGPTRYPYNENNAPEGPAEDFSYTWPAAAMRKGGGDCESCHGENGAGRPGGEAPNLSIQTPRYLQAALVSFATGARPSAIMQNVATSLSAPEMASVAGHFGGKMLASPDTVANNAAARTLGRQIALGGIPSRNVTACTSCHGVEGASKVGFPVIAGQNARYLTQQMLLFRTGDRGRTEGYDPMNAEAHALTDREISGVATFYAALAPGASPTQKTASIQAR